MYYFLKDDKTYVPCDMEQWANQFKEMFIQKTKHVADEYVNGYRISTVWFGIDHNHFGGRPLLFETMVFDGGGSGNDIYCEQYTTWDEAVEGHKRAVQWVLDGCKDENV